MTIMPFVCLGVGFIFSMVHMPTKIVRMTDKVINATLILLMLSIGMNIGANDEVINNIGTIGLNCAIISLLSIALSALLTHVFEKTILPLNEISLGMQSEVAGGVEDKQEKSPVVFIIPVSIVGGAVIGLWILPDKYVFLLDYTLLISLIILYTGVGFGMGNNRSVFKYVKELGVRVLLLPLAITAGSLLGGLAAGYILRLPVHTSVISASGMSYYSLTGAYMTQTYGIAEGTYGFLVNVMREFFTVLLLPLLIKISKGSPIAAGAAGNMDTMLMPVTKFVGSELSLVTLITGTVLTFLVPFLLPVLGSML